MMYICIHCGHHFDEPHNRYNRRWSDSDDSEQYCPNCGREDIEEAGHCIKCGDYFPLDNTNGAPNYMIGSICKDCVEKRATLANAYQYGMDRGFDRHELDGASDTKVRHYCLDDIFDFSEWLEGQES